MSGSAPSNGSAAEPIFVVTEGDGPLVISVPHSGTHLPPEVAARLRPEVRDLPDTDWFVPRLYEFHDALGASMIRATHSRYLVDLNRPPDGALLYPGRRETSVCPTETFDGEPLYRNGEAPDATEVEARLRRYWKPYHQALREMLDRRLARHGYCFLWDAHSIRSSVPALFEGRLPDLNVGTADGRSCLPRTIALVRECLSSQTRYTSVIDGRFKGGYITRHYGEPARGIEAVQLEMAQSAYLHEERLPRFDAPTAAPMIALLRNLLARLIGSRPGG
ncbi:MAG: N-formylglutamate deformylase [Gammaproteobacteria bacterium]|nr:N-formylglutamate deformylase [Gammaproteobacteria bacterium]